MINDMVKILRINAYIQYGKGDIWLEGKRVICVSLDNTCAVWEAMDEITLTPEQLDNLFNQTLGTASQAG